MQYVQKDHTQNILHQESAKHANHIVLNVQTDQIVLNVNSDGFFKDNSVNYHVMMDMHQLTEYASHVEILTDARNVQY